MNRLLALLISISAGAGVAIFLIFIFGFFPPLIDKNYSSDFVPPLSQSGLILNWLISVGSSIFLYRSITHQNTKKITDRIVYSLFVFTLLFGLVFITIISPVLDTYKYAKYRDSKIEMNKDRLQMQRTKGEDIDFGNFSIVINQNRCVGNTFKLNEAGSSTIKYEKGKICTVSLDIKNNSETGISTNDFDLKLLNSTYGTGGRASYYTKNDNGSYERFDSNKIIEPNSTASLTGIFGVGSGFSPEIVSVYNKNSLKTIEIGLYK